MAAAPESPKAFISYSWTNDEHVAWVVRLAERLVADGVEVVLDQWDLKEGQDKYAFMEQLVTDSSVKKVLAICDQLYAEKADGRRGGVGTESQIISKEIYERVNQEKFIPLVRERDEDGKEYLPVFFRSRIYIDFCDDEQFEESYDKLLRNIYSRPARTKPQLGQPPAYLFAEGATQVKTAGKLQRLKDAAQKQKPHTHTMLDEYLESFLDVMEDFRIQYTRNAEQPFGEIVVNSITTFLPYRDNFVDFIELVAGYMNEDKTYDSIFEFLERFVSYKHRPARAIPWYEDACDNYRFIIYELCLYLIATLIRMKRYAAAARFIENSYHFSQIQGGAEYVTDGIGAFREPMHSLERRTDQQVNARSPAELVKDRATRQKMPFRDLYQADFLLFIRPFFPHPGTARDWYPLLLGYGREVGTLELFAKATSDRGIAPLRQLLKVKSIPELVSQIDAMLKNRDFTSIAHSDRAFRFNLGTLLNLDALKNAGHAT